MLKLISALFLQKHILLFITLPILVAGTVFTVLYLKGYENSVNQLLSFNDQQSRLRLQLGEVKKQYDDLKGQDQIKINNELKKEIDNIQMSYKKSVGIYEQLADLKASGGKVDELNKIFALSLKQLSERKYEEADKSLTDVSKKLEEEKTRIAQLAIKSAPVANAPVNNSAPGSGYQRQKVSTDIGEFLVDIVAADLNSAKVIIDTASDSDCRDNCPALPLGDYVSRSGAFAGVNGSYFCPPEYPSCAGKTNSFDTLLMNKNKHYFNSDNNVYSTVPAAIFSPGSARFVTQSLQWGRDTGVDAVIANYPLLLLGGQITAAGGDAKQVGKGTRAFVGHADGKVFIGVAHNVSVSEMAKVLQTLGLKDALNLDSGGSIAMWANGGYKAGPGRNIPNAVLLVRR